MVERPQGFPFLLISVISICLSVFVVLNSSLETGRAIVESGHVVSVEGRAALSSVTVDLPESCGALQDEFPCRSAPAGVFCADFPIDRLRPRDTVQGTPVHSAGTEESTNPPLVTVQLRGCIAQVAQDVREVELTMILPPENGASVAGSAVSELDSVARSLSEPIRDSYLLKNIRFGAAADELSSTRLRLQMLF